MNRTMTKFAWAGLALAGLNRPALIRLLGAGAALGGAALAFGA